MEKGKGAFGQSVASALLYADTPLYVARKLGLSRAAKVP